MAVTEYWKQSQFLQWQYASKELVTQATAKVPDISQIRERLKVLCERNGFLWNPVRELGILGVTGAIPWETLEKHCGAQSLSHLRRIRDDFVKGEYTIQDSMLLYLAQKPKPRMIMDQEFVEEMKQEADPQYKKHPYYQEAYAVELQAEALIRKHYLSLQQEDR